MKTSFNVRISNVSLRSFSLTIIRDRMNKFSKQNALTSLRETKYNKRILFPLFFFFYGIQIS